MPAGYWAWAWTALWQTTFTNSILLIITFWIRRGKSLESIFMPVAAPLTLMALGIGAILIGSLVGYAVGIFSRGWSIWAATGGFALIYLGYSMPKPKDYASVFAGVEGFQFVLGLVALGIWWLRVVHPFLSVTELDR